MIWCINDWSTNQFQNKVLEKQDEKADLEDSNDFGDVLDDHHDDANEEFLEKIDKYSFRIFPITFAICNIPYWLYYVGFSTSHCGTNWLKCLSVTTSVVGLQTDNVGHVGQNSSAHVARSIAAIWTPLLIKWGQLLWYLQISFHRAHLPLHLNWFQPHLSDRIGSVFNCLNLELMFWVNDRKSHFFYFMKEKFWKRCHLSMDRFSKFLWPFII